MGIITQDCYICVEHFLSLIVFICDIFVQKFKQPVFDYLMNVLKIANDETRYAVTLTALRDLCIRYGPDMFSPHKEYLIQRRDTEQSTNVQQGFAALIDQIEGRR